MKCGFSGVLYTAAFGRMKYRNSLIAASNAGTIFYFDLIHIFNLDSLKFYNEFL